MTGFSEADWELVALDTLGAHEWITMTGTEIAPGADGGRESWADLVLPERLLDKMRELNPGVPGDYLDQARAAILQPQSQDALNENYRLHGYLVGGYRGISYIDSDGIEQNPTIRLISHRPDENQFLAVELKQAGAQHANVAKAHAQLQTYLREFPMAFRFAVLTEASDGITARYGTPFTPLEHFAPWNVDDDGKLVTTGDLAVDENVPIKLETRTDGLFNTERFLQLLRNFTASDEDGDGLTKRIAKPHQYFAVTNVELNLHRPARTLGYETFNCSRLLAESPIKVTKRAELRDELTHELGVEFFAVGDDDDGRAVGSTVQAAETDGKAGVVWHSPARLPAGQAQESVPPAASTVIDQMEALAPQYAERAGASRDEGSTG